MQLKRTANAGVLLKLDGVSILLDGVCREVKPYPATPPEERALLSACYPDVVAFTHAHKDHYDPAYAAEYSRQTGRVILGPEQGVRGSMSSICVNGVTITPRSCRHIGASGKDTPHAGFIIQGSKTVWFTGDSSPSQWRNCDDLPKPDVLIVPYAYANTPSSWGFTKSFGAVVVLVHMPDEENDTVGLWTAVKAATGPDRSLMIPKFLQTICIS